jgi:hypothetical protein
MATGDRFFGFDLIQRKTLAALMADGLPLSTTTQEGVARQAATQAAVATANATDLATAQALANDLKVQYNALLTKLKAAGLVA